MTIADVKELVVQAHAGQTDKQGRDYVDGHLTPIADALRPFGEDAEAAGWLHDVLEDTDLTEQDLTDRGISPVVVRAVVSVTRAEETYKELIGRACADELGRLVKLADNAWNVLCNPGLAEIEPRVAAEMLRRRYLPARQRLLGACGWTLDSPEVVALYVTLEGHYRRLNG